MVGIGLGFVVLYTGLYFQATNFTTLTLLYIRTILNEAMNTIIYDMKDLEADRINGVDTFPLVLGIQNTKYLLHFINVTVAAITLAGFLIHAFPLCSLGLLVSLPYFTFLIEYLVHVPYRKGHLLLQYTLLDGTYMVMVPFVLLLANYF